MLKAVLTVGNVAGLAVLAGLSLGAAGVRQRTGGVFAVSAIGLLTWPVAYTLHLGEVDLILAALIGVDVLRGTTAAGGRGSGRGWPPGSS